MADFSAGVDTGARWRRQIAQIDAELHSRIKTDPELARRFEVLTSIPGIRPIAAIAMIIEMPELGTMSPKKLQASQVLRRSSGNRERGRAKHALAEVVLPCAACC